MKEERGFSPFFAAENARHDIRAAIFRQRFDIADVRWLFARRSAAMTLFLRVQTPP